MVKNSPSTTLLSSGRKEYSATKITAYFSPKPLPVASPQIPIEPKSEARGECEREVIAEAKAGFTASTERADMPVATRKRTAQAQSQSQPQPSHDIVMNGVQAPETPTPIPPSAAAHYAAALNNNNSTAPSRNIDKVIFGTLLFDTSYPSRHVREIIGDKVAEGKDMLDRLCVCPHCFKYTSEIVRYLGHLKVCERRSGAGNMVPGKRVYNHGEGWEVWEVDGEDEQLYCQNLSLFAKLFLGDKSVSFDVSAFIFYLLVHTSTEQVIGFFSKEKQSWDSNNLACILVFPPWQRKGLGSILMALSYHISQAEGLIGGPEKPLSELGKRGYVRYWGGEIARWLLGRNGKEGGKITLEEISRETWILKEDCLDALREMGGLDEEDIGRANGDAEVKIDLQKVREWVERTKTSLLPTVNSNGWCDEFYRRESLGDEEEVESEE